MAITRADTRLTPELIEKYTAAGYWTERTLADVFHQNAREIPDKIAYSDCRSQVTWSDLWRISGEVASVPLLSSRPTQPFGQCGRTEHKMKHPPRRVDGRLGRGVQQQRPHQHRPTAGNRN